jgi:hypothetical protein
MMAKIRKLRELNPGLTFGLPWIMACDAYPELRSAKDGARVDAPAIAQTTHAITNVSPA